MAITLKYKTIQRPDGTETRCPIIPLVLRWGEIVEYLGLPDSGADVSALHVSVAEILGMDLSGREDKSFGIGGGVRSKESQVQIQVSKGHESYTFTIPVKVILDDFDFGVMLLGRKGFFDKFIITFDESNEKFKLKRNTCR